MANRFNSPFEEFHSSTSPYSGGILRFFISGTSTPLAYFTDSALSAGSATTHTLNAAGRPTTAIFLQNLLYKVTLEDSAGNPIWTADPVYTSDYSASAQFTVYAGNPNGNVAGTAGTGIIPSSVIWDSTNSILYVCTTSGVAAAAVWTAVNASATTPAVPPPQGRLTLTSATPVLAADVVAATAVYYTPFTGNLIPIYNGTSMVPTEFAELTLTLVASHSADSLFDIFCFSNSGTLTLATGPAWTTQTPGSSARGAGAGTTQLSRVKGIYTNTVSMTGRNGSTTYTIAANRGTFLGTIYTDHTAGQTSYHVGYGQNRKNGFSNAFNRQPIFLKAGDGTASWTPASTRASNNVPSSYSAVIANVGGTTSNGMTVLNCLPEEPVLIRFSQRGQATASTTGTPHEATIGVGVNSISSFSGKLGDILIQGTTGTAAVNRSDLVGGYLLAPSLGVNQIMAMENLVAGANIVVYGAENFMVLSAEFRG